MFYLNNTNDGKRIKALIKAYAAKFNAFLSGCAPEEKFSFFSQEQSEGLEEFYKTMKNIYDQFTYGRNWITKAILNFSDGLKAILKIPGELNEVIKAISEPINPIKELVLEIRKCFGYYPTSPTMTREEIEKIINFISVEDKWFAERFPNDIQERDIINNSNSVISLLDNNIRQAAISFNVFEPRGDHTTYNICISKDKNGGYFIGGYVGNDIFNYDCSFKKRYDKNGELLDKTENPTNQTQEKISKVIDSVNDEFRNSKFDINVMYEQLKKPSHKKLNLAGKNLFILKDGINMATTMENEEKIRIKKIFNSPGFVYYPTGLTMTREEIGKIIK